MSKLSEHTERTKSIVEMDKRHWLHPAQNFDLFAKNGALPIESGKGMRLRDTDGNEYLDAIGGMWCTNIGLGNEEMVEAIADQARQLAYANPFVDVTNEPAARLAAKIASLTPGDLNHVFFTNSGSEAVESAFRLITYYQRSMGRPERKHFISRKDSYHGSTYACMSLGGKEADKVPELDYKTDTIHHVDSINYYRNANGRSEQQFADDLVDGFIAKVEELGGPDKVAGYFAEVIIASGGVATPPGDYLQRTREYCREHDIVYVSDEVVTGFGRCGEWFASESLYGIVPDMITMAKGLTSGYIPMGAMAFSDRIFDALGGEGKWFSHGFTYSGHPVAAAAALKNIEIIEKTGLLEHVREVGPYFEEQLKTLEDLPMVGEVRGKALMMCVELVADKETKRNYPAEVDIGKRVSDFAEEMGLMVRPLGNLSVMSPALIITRDDIDFIVATLREAIIKARAQVEAEGHH